VQSRWPKIIRTIKLERFWRLISQPKRNYKKVLNILSGFNYIFWYLLLKKR
jgi:UDP-N-acetyl-D-mannosaminuronic acid transferase (WecB/TagA/CpsF family)